ncbi:hypothetical protein F5Y07DRAFT_413086 [Xylaria sp. FL0933]|nr:hypothetical protein F5Y07DRAFT_413086 [Xylaria sp. FL0933]
MNRNTPFDGAQPDDQRRNLSRVGQAAPLQAIQPQANQLQAIQRQAQAIQRRQAQAIQTRANQLQANQPLAILPQVNQPLVNLPQAGFGLPHNMAMVHDRAGQYTFIPGAGEGSNGLVECLVCEEQSKPENLYHLPCTHWHCQGCLRENFRLSLASNPFRPAKCCVTIPGEVLRKYGVANNEESLRYKQKIEELTNPRSKLYCWGSDCGAFIPSADRTKLVGVCTQCGRKTCKTCQAKAHFGPCDKARLQSVRESEDTLYMLIEQKGWKKCPNCTSIVQKIGGCDHMM